MEQMVEKIGTQNTGTKQMVEKFGTQNAGMKESVDGLKGVVQKMKLNGTMIEKVNIYIPNRYCKLLLIYYQLYIYSQ